MTMTYSIDLAPLSDAQLVQRCAERDERAFEQIVRRYQSLVCSVAFNRCGDLALSEDLAQEAFLQVWQKLDELKDFEKFKAWICTIVRNLARRLMQRQRRSPAGNLDALPEIATGAECPADIGVMAAQVTVRHPISSVRAYQVGLAITALLTIGMMSWRREAWQPAFANYLFWFTGALQAMAMSVAILSVLAWNRGYGKRG